MSREEIVLAIKGLAQSQGFYGRVLSNLTDEQLDYLEAQNFKDVLDMILWFEE